MSRIDKAEWNRGFWQADADLKNEGDILYRYKNPSLDFQDGYRARVQNRAGGGRYDGAGSGTIVAYKEWESRSRWNEVANKPVMIRKEFRIRTVKDYAPGELTLPFKLGGTHVLEERFLADGVEGEEGWRQHDIATSRREALEMIDTGSDMVALDPTLQKIWAEHGAMQREGAARELKARAEADTAAERYQRHLRSRAAFDKLMKSKWAAVGESWNVFMQAHIKDPAFKKRVQADPEFMRLYQAAIYSDTVPSKRKTIKEFLEYAEPGSMGCFGDDDCEDSLGGADEGELARRSPRPARMQIVIAWTTIEQELVERRRDDLGERHKFRDVIVPHAMMWLRAGTAEDLRKAKEYVVSRELADADHLGTQVFTYTKERDPLGRAKRDVLAMARPL